MATFIEFDCPSCGQKNRSPAAQLWSNPKCSYCRHDLKDAFGRPKALPSRWVRSVARLSVFSVGLILLVSLLSTLTSVSMIWYVGLALLYGLILIVRRFIRDNTDVLYSMGWNGIGRTTMRAVFLWVPYALFLTPGIAVVYMIDRQIDIELNSARDAVKDTYKDVMEPEMVPADIWSHPVNFFMGTMIPKMVPKRTREQVEGTTLLLWTLVEKFLLLTKWYFNGFLCYLVLRSFGCIWSRAVLGKHVGLKLIMR